MTERVQRGELAIAKELYDFIVNQAIEGTGIALMITGLSLRRLLLS